MKIKLKWSKSSFHFSNRTFSLAGPGITLIIIIAISSTVANLNPLYGQTIEICDNAIDDDGDQLIDYNDPDCTCNNEIPESLIPNPSFEERSCCPEHGAQLFCADDWIQASVATTDYIHTCDFMGWLATAPTPFPDGNACIGFRNGRPPSQPNFKEYTGACLTQAMEAGATYLLEFYVGFYPSPNSPSFNIAIFGSPNCNNLPFGGSDQNFGCPSNGPGWNLLAEKQVSGNNEWVLIQFEFTPDEAINAIAIGPECDSPGFSTSIHHYYFFDRLILAKKLAFGFEVSPMSGHPCTGDYVLGTAAVDSLSYQWYKDGIAVIGATESIYQVPPGEAGEGAYRLRTSSNEGCEMSQSFIVEIDKFNTSTEAEICDGESYFYEGQDLTEEGTYFFDLLTDNGCDSTVELNLIVHSHDTLLLSENICEGDFFEIGGEQFDQSGSYGILLNNQWGCDSLVLLDLSVEPPYVYPNLGADKTVDLGTKILLNPRIDFDLVQEFQWTSGQYDLCGDCDKQEFLAVNSDTIIFEGIDIQGCPIYDEIIMEVMPNYEVYIPNVFSPNFDGLNDRFFVFASANVLQIDQLTVFNRWGAQVFLAKEIPPNTEALGWDGKFNGKVVDNGVYTYLIEISFLDGNSKQFGGSVMVVR